MRHTHCSQVHYVGFGWFWPIALISVLAFYILNILITLQSCPPPSTLQSHLFLLNAMSFSLLCSGDGDQTSVEHCVVVLLPVKLTGAVQAAAEMVCPSWPPLQLPA